MSHTNFETGLFITLVQASLAEGAQGNAEAMAAARSVAADTPEHMTHSVLKSLEAQGLLTIRSTYLDGQTMVRISGQGDKAADRIRAQSAAQIETASTPPRKMGF